MMWVFGWRNADFAGFYWFFDYVLRFRICLLDSVHRIVRLGFSSGSSTNSSLLDESVFRSIDLFRFFFVSFLQHFGLAVCVIRSLPNYCCLQRPSVLDAEFFASFFAFVVVFVIQFLFYLSTTRCSLGEYDSVLSILLRRRTFTEQATGLSNRSSIRHGLIRFGRAIYRDTLRMFPSRLECRIRWSYFGQFCSDYSQPSVRLPVYFWKGGDPSLSSGHWLRCTIKESKSKVWLY